MVWVFKIKQPKIGEEIGRFKARCCLLGNLMDPSNLNFSSPTPRLSSFRYALSWAAKTGAAVWSADVEQAFLLAAPAEPIYATFPPGFEDPNGKVMFLLKNLYGSTTAPFQFNNYLSNSLILQGFKPNPFDPCLFSKMVEGSLMIVLTFVDDSIAIHRNPKVLEDFYNVCGTALGGAFKFGQLEKDLTRFLGFDIIRDKSGFILSQVPLIEKIFKIAKDWMPHGTWDQLTTYNTHCQRQHPRRRQPSRSRQSQYRRSSLASTISLQRDLRCDRLCRSRYQTGCQLQLQVTWSMGFVLRSTSVYESAVASSVLTSNQG